MSRAAELWTTPPVTVVRAARRGAAPEPRSIPERSPPSDLVDPLAVVEPVALSSSRMAAQLAPGLEAFPCQTPEHSHNGTARVSSAVVLRRSTGCRSIHTIYWTPAPSTPVGRGARPTARATGGFGVYPRARPMWRRCSPSIATAPRCSTRGATATASVRALVTMPSVRAMT